MTQMWWSALQQRFDAERQPCGDEALEPLDAARLRGGLRLCLGRALLHLHAVGNQAKLGNKLIPSGEWFNTIGRTCMFVRGSCKRTCYYQWTIGVIVFWACLPIGHACHVCSIWYNRNNLTVFWLVSIKPDSAYTTGTTNQKKVWSIGNSKCDRNP